MRWLTNVERCVMRNEPRGLRLTMCHGRAKRQSRARRLRKPGKQSFQAEVIGGVLANGVAA